MYTKKKAILAFKQEIAILAGHVSAYARYDRKDEITNFDAWTLWTFMVVERAVMVSLLDKGVTVDERGVLYNPADEHRRQFMSPVTYAIRFLNTEYPRQCLELLDQMRMKRNIAAHVGNIDKETLATFIATFKTVINWFLLETDSLYKEYESTGVVSAYNDLDRDISYAFLFENQRILLDNAAIMNEKLDRLLSGQQEIKEKLDTIQEKIEAINDRINGYQSLVEKQIELASSEEEEEHILHAFTQECVDRIISNVGGQFNKREYDTELTKLKLSFGDGAWNKMDESSRTFLASAKMMFNQFAGMEDIVDYSGVCLLVTKALEVEMSKRFCDRYIAYLKTKYPGKANLSKFPYSMLNRYGKPLSPKHFTLGSVAFVTSISVPDDATEEQIVHNTEELKGYAKAELFAGSPEIDILGTLQYYASRVDDIRERFRNPSAHTNEVKRINAIECFETVVDVEKLLRIMLDSFDK